MQVSKVLRRPTAVLLGCILLASCCDECGHAKKTSAPPPVMQRAPEVAARREPAAVPQEGKALDPDDARIGRYLIRGGIVFIVLMMIAVPVQNYRDAKKGISNDGDGPNFDMGSSDDFG
jgi:hypothetical protein